MAQPVPRVIDLSTLRSDGTNQGLDGTQIPRQHADYRNCIRKKLTDAFNRNHDNNPYIADQLTKYGPHQSIGDLPRGYTLWTHPSKKNQTDIEELYGHPSGEYFRSARRFSGHVGEMLVLKDVREASLRAEVHRDNKNMARSAIQSHNVLTYYQARVQNIDGIVLDINNLNDARRLSWPRRDADAEVLADRQSTAAVAFTCVCVLRWSPTQ